MATMLTLDDLRRIMRQCAGEDDGVDLDGPIEDVPFEELGYDSLALLEIAGRIQRELGVTMPDESISFMTTPEKALEYVNQRLATV